MINNLSRRSVVALVIGNALEWYDFVVYSFMTIFIAKLFFPGGNMTNSILAATATFGVAFFMRPLGGILFGIYADRKGRKAAITAVIALMTIALLILAAAPTYKQIGIYAPLLIVLSRLLQGFSAGGEFGASMAMLVELAPAHRRGFYGSWQMVGQMFAMLLGATAGMIITRKLSVQEIEAWGWRIPFIAGLIIAPVGIYIRSTLHESFIPKGKLARVPVFFQKIRQQWQHLILAMGLIVGGTVSNYINISYMPTYATRHLNISMNMAFTSLAIGASVMMIFIPVFASLSDKVGRKPVLIISMLLYLVSIYPLFLWLVNEPSVAKLMLSQLIFCLILSAYFGVYAVVVAELFPRDVRSTGMGISYNFSVMLFGGFAQFIVTWLIDATGTPMAITYYLIFAICISLLAAICYKEKQ